MSSVDEGITGAVVQGDSTEGPRWYFRNKMTGTAVRAAHVEVDAVQMIALHFAADLGVPRWNANAPVIVVTENATL